MVKTLIKKQLMELFQSYFVDKKTGKAKDKNKTLRSFVFFGLLFFCLGFAFYNMAKGLGAAVFGQGSNWLYFAIMGLMAVVLGLFGSVFNTYGSLYLPKDNELLFSLPIPVKKLLIARVISVYLMSLLYSALVWIPVIIAYWVLVPVTALQIIFPILITFVLALFVTVLSCILGWIVALVASKTKGKSYITVILSIAVMAVYFVVYFKIIGSLNEILTKINQIEGTVKSWLYYLYLTGKAADGDWLSFVIVSVVTIALFALCFFVLSKTFTKFALMGKGSVQKAKAKDHFVQRTVRSALLRREYLHFTSLSTWMLNGGLGLLIMPIAAIALLIKRESIQGILTQFSATVPQLSAGLPLMLLVMMGFLLSTGVLTPVSVSIEGKNLWILQSLPIDPWRILHEKENMAVRLMVFPALFLALVCGFVFGLTILQMLLFCVSVWFYTWLAADFGLFLNLKHPNLAWTNPVYLVKQSMPVVIYLFGGYGFSLLMGVTGYFLMQVIPIEVVLAMDGVLILVLWRILHCWLKTKGTVILETL